MTPAGSPGFLPALGMWLLMTLVMMGPVVLPWLRAVGTLAEAGGGSRAHGRPRPRGSGAVLARAPFAVGYLAAWAGFSAAAAGVQHGLAGLGAGGPLLEASPTLAGTSLVLAGAFQFTALKDACLSHCRSPFGWLLSHWRPGVRGAVAMGFRHGLFCLGCCWALMLLALVVGMTNLLAMALLMVVMVLETAAPFGRRLARPAGAVLALLGIAVLLG